MTHAPARLPVYAFFVGPDGASYRVVPAPDHQFAITHESLSVAYGVLHTYESLIGALDGLWALLRAAYPRVESIR